MKENSNVIRTYIKTKCILCGDEGSEVYTGLKDNLFDVPGVWSVRKCENTDCGLMWAGNMPVLEDIPRLYEKYYTHQSIERNSFVSRVYETVLKGYLSTQYGYHGANIFQKLLGYLVYIEPGVKALADSKVYELPYVKDGNLLEVGCGDGRNLKFLQDFGWNVEGIDLDGQAINNAAKKGLNVSVSELIDKHYPDSNFEVVVCKHVIEHIPNPVEFLEEVQRVLKPGGTLVMYTPNSGSVGLKIFQSNWRGLEPPRHLFIYNTISLERMAEQAGFINTSCKSTFAGAPILLSSYSLFKNKKITSKVSVGQILKLVFLHYVEFLIVICGKNSGEEIIIKARKNK